MYFDYLSVSLNPDKADGLNQKINWIFEDSNDKFAVNVQNSALTYISGKTDQSAATTVSLKRPSLDRVLLGSSTFDKEVEAGHVKVSGDTAAVRRFFEIFDVPSTNFPIVTPRDAGVSTGPRQ